MREPPRAISASPARDDSLAEGEVYLRLSIPVFLAGLSAETLRLAIGHLSGARRALEESCAEVDGGVARGETGKRDNTTKMRICGRTIM